MLCDLDVLEKIAKAITPIKGRVVVAIDGVDGAGKTTFADELAPLIQKTGRSKLRAPVDGFHNPRAIRYQLGRDSPEGLFRDSYNYESLSKNLLHPFKSGSTTVKLACFDHRSDYAVNVEGAASADTVLLLDGVFLHRDALIHHWDFSVFLSLPFQISHERMAKRDGCDPNPFAPANRRYFEGQSLYLRTCQPHTRATIVVENFSSSHRCRASIVCHQSTL